MENTFKLQFALISLLYNILTFLQASLIMLHSVTQIKHLKTHTFTNQHSKHSRKLLMYLYAVVESN